MSTRTAPRQMHRTPVTPSTVKSFNQYQRLLTDTLSPCSRAIRLGTNRYHAIITSVARLISICGPLEVAGLVVAIIVDAIEGMFCRRSRPYCCIEFFKRFKAKLDATFSVQMVFRDAALAPTFGQLISVQFWGSKAAGRMTVGSRTPYQFSIKTSARLGIALAKSTRIHADNIAAYALAIPRCSFRFTGTGIAEYSQTPKPLSSVISEVVDRWKWFKNDGIFIVGHEVFSFLENLVVRPVQDCLRLARATSILSQTMQMRVSFTHA